MENVEVKKGFDLKAAARAKAAPVDIQTVDIVDMITSIGATELAIGTNQQSGKTYLHLTGATEVYSIRISDKCGEYQDIKDLVNNNVVYCGTGVGEGNVPYYWFTLSPASGTTGERVSVADFMKSLKSGLKAGA